jgi:hypothetical protein
VNRRLASPRAAPSLSFVGSSLPARPPDRFGLPSTRAYISPGPYNMTSTVYALCIIFRRCKSSGEENLKGLGGESGRMQVVAIQSREFAMNIWSHSLANLRTCIIVRVPNRQPLNWLGKQDAMNSGELLTPTTPMLQFGSLFGSHRTRKRCSRFSPSTRPNWATFGTTALHARAKRISINGIVRIQSEGRGSE